MTQSDFFALCRECETILRMSAPYKTGNLRYNAIKIKMPDANTCVLYVDEKVAPYMKYTNEPWKSGKNPNEGWFDKAAQRIAWHIAERTGGILQ